MHVQAFSDLVRAPRGGFGHDLRDDSGQFSVDYVCERHFFEDGSHIGSRGDPDFSQVFRRPVIVELVRAFSANRGEGPLDRSDDVGDRHFLRGLCEPVAASRPALARNYSRVSELGKYVLEELHRDLLVARDVISLQRSVPSGRGELSGGSDRVVNLRGNAHGYILAWRGSAAHLR
jgi:hypothetical protein